MIGGKDDMGQNVSVLGDVLMGNELDQCRIVVSGELGDDVECLYWVILLYWEDVE